MIPEYLSGGKPSLNCRRFCILQRDLGGADFESQAFAVPHVFFIAYFY